MQNPSRALPPVIDKAYGFVLREGATGRELLAVVPMRPCAALAAAGRAIRAGACGREGGFSGRGDTPQGPPAAEGAPLTPTLSPQGEGAGRSRGGRRAIRAGGVGAPPPQKENPRAGGWASSGPARYPSRPRHDRAHAPPGWGCGERSPPQTRRGTDREMVPPSRRRCAPAAFEGARESPLTPALSPQGEGAGRPRGGRRAIRAGGVEAEPPTERKSEGGWVGPERPCEVSLASTTRPCARSSGIGVWGAQPLADEGEGQTVRWFRPRGGAAPPRLSRARGSLPLSPGRGSRTGRSALGAQAGRSFRSSEHQQGSGFRTKRGPPHGGPHAWAAKRRNAQGVRTGSCSSSAGGSGSGALAIFSAVTSPST